MITPMMGVPAFVCRLIPVYSLKHDLIVQQTLKVIELTHASGGFAFLLMSDNLRSNQACFKVYKEKFGSSDNYLFYYPVKILNLTIFICYMTQLTC